MTKTFTEDDLVRFIYGETTPKENEAIGNAIMCDSVMQESYRKLQEAVSFMNNGMMVPGEKVVDKILNYSKNYGDLSVLK